MELEELRKHIDKIDKEIIDLLFERLSLVTLVADYKMRHSLKMVDPERESQIIDEKKRIALMLGLRKEYAEDIFKRIIAESHFIENKIMEYEK